MNKQVRHSIFTQFEFGLMSEVFERLGTEKIKKNRLALKSQLKSFLIGMIKLRGNVVPKDLVILSISKVYSAETDEIDFLMYYEGSY